MLGPLRRRVEPLSRIIHMAALPSAEALAALHCLGAFATTQRDSSLRPRQLATSFISDVACWHLSDVTSQSDDVSSCGQSGYRSWLPGIRNYSAYRPTAGTYASS